MYSYLDYKSYKNNIKEVGDKVSKSTVEILKEFKDFIISKNIISLAIGLVLATQINTLSKSFSQGLVDPIINRGLTHITKDLNKFDVNVLSMQFKIGMIFSDLINLLCVIIIIFVIWKLSLFIYKKYNQEPKKQ